MSELNRLLKLAGVKVNVALTESVMEDLQQKENNGSDDYNFSNVPDSELKDSIPKLHALGLHRAAEAAATECDRRYGTRSDAEDINIPEGKPIAGYYADEHTGNDPDNDPDESDDDRMERHHEEEIDEAFIDGPRAEYVKNICQTYPDPNLAKHRAVELLSHSVGRPLNSKELMQLDSFMQSCNQSGEIGEGEFDQMNIKSKPWNSSPEQSNSFDDEAGIDDEDEYAAHLDSLGQAKGMIEDEHEGISVKELPFDDEISDKDYTLPEDDDSEDLVYVDVPDQQSNLGNNSMNPEMQRMKQLAGLGFGPEVKEDDEDFQAGDSAPEELVPGDEWEEPAAATAGDSEGDVVDVGDDDMSFDDQDAAAIPAEPSKFADLSIDPGEMIHVIDQMQQTGMSSANAFFDIDKLHDMPIDRLARVYKKVIGQKVEEEDDNWAGDSGYQAGTEDNGYSNSGEYRSKKIFPDGAVGNPTPAAGPTAARNGDNPLYTGMKEGYAYTNSTDDIRKKLEEAFKNYNK